MTHDIQSKTVILAQTREYSSIREISRIPFSQIEPVSMNKFKVCCKISFGWFNGFKQN